MTGKPLVYLTPNCTPFFNKVYNLLVGRAVGQPHRTIQKNIYKVLSLKIFCLILQP